MQGGGQGMERIHAAKMAYITDRLRLTSDQMINFVPVYNEYDREIRETRNSFLKKYKEKDFKNADDASARQFVDDNLDYQQQVIQIKRRYNERFLKVISSQQLAELSQAEREFRQLLMERIKDRQNGNRRWR